MDDLDRLVWAGGLAFTMQGLRVGMRVDDPAMLEVMSRHLPPDAVPASGADVDYLYSVWTVPGLARRGTRHWKQLYFDTQQVARSLQIDDLAVALASHVNDLVATMGMDHVFVADTAVVVFDGAAALLVGGSARTRMRLADACTDRGAVSYSSAYAVLDLAGDVHPHREGPVAVRVVAFAGEQVAPPASVSPGWALVALIEKTPSARVRPAAVMQALRAGVAQASLLEGPWFDVERVAADLLGRMRSNSAEVPNKQGD